MDAGSFLLFLGLSLPTQAPDATAPREYHVSLRGDDGNDGTEGRPLRTISAAARIARPGDTITVHEGVYRERVAPPRGGESQEKRIVYRAAPGEKVVIKGSEVVKGWVREAGDTWKVSIPNAFFGEFNPYADLIRGDWFHPKGREHHTGAVYRDGHWLAEAARLEEVLGPAGEPPLWFARVGEAETTIWAQFPGADPNESEVEINVRRTVFYPERPGIDCIAVIGFTMMHAATPWAPPTAEQIGLIGTHWSKGWLIEGNDIRYSTCVGIALGKYGDEYDNTSQNTAEGYVKTIERALAAGWSKGRIGHHIVRGNRISHCEQAGIVGSLGAAFSTIEGNVIHDIHVRQLFTGAEMAGIKIHAAIDVRIAGNHIYRTCRGIWLDWMAQGTRVTRNLLHDNAASEDLFVEVNHGPFLIDHNIFLSGRSLLDMSQGGAYAHNLLAGSIRLAPELRRRTPFHEPHSTELAGLTNIPGGDDRFVNNLLVHPADLSAYDDAAKPCRMEGNVFLEGAKPCRAEKDPLVLPDVDPGIRLLEEPDGMRLRIALQRRWAEARRRRLVTTEILGRAAVPDLPYERPDGTPYRLDRDYRGARRDPENPFPGPFEPSSVGPEGARVWPPADGEKDEGWIPLFNGKDLEGWTIKIKGRELNDNYLDTFRVEDGILKVCYDKYRRFDGAFGYIFHEGVFSRYRLRVEYRFVGEQTPGGPGWAFRNSGIMLHGQTPETMRKDQDFPVSIEVQLLGGSETGARPTANLCTPGTHVVMDGELITRHCTESRSKTYRGDRWVTVEVEVLGSERIRHIVEGETVLQYEKPQLDPADPDARALAESRGGQMLLSEGTISLQAESHPVEFRRVEIFPLGSAAGSAPAAGPYALWKNGPGGDPSYFPIAVWLQAPRNAPRYKEIGIDLYVGLWQGPTEAQLAELERHGMPVICDQNEFARTQLDRKIIVGWMHGDEPDNAQPLPGAGGYGPPIDPARIVDDYRRIAKNDPTRPVLLNLGQGVAWDRWHGRGVRTNHPEDYPRYVEGCDIASFDIYPAVHSNREVAGKLWYVARGVSRLRAWSGERPVWSCIECTRIGNPDRKPTPREVRAEVWMALVHGARGIIYFCHQFKPSFIEAGLLADEEMAKAVGGINREIASLAAVLNSPSRPELLEVESDPAEVSEALRAAMEARPIACALKRLEGKTYIFAVRMEDAPARATFAVRGIPAKARARVLGEDRTIDVIDGRFRDEFGPYAVHLYRIE